MSRDARGNPYYPFALKGRAYIPHLCQALENHPNISRYEGYRSGFDYTFETEAGVAYIEIGEVDEGDQSSLDYTDSVYIELSIATPPEFIEDLITLLDELAKVFTFVVKILWLTGYPHPPVEKVDLSTIYPVVEYPKLRDEYQVAYQYRKVGAGIGTFFLDDNPLIDKRPDLTGSASYYFFAAGLIGFLPICVFLCPEKIGAKVAFVDSYLQFELEGSLLELDPKQSFYQKIKAIQLEQGQVLQINEEDDFVVLGGENFRIPLRFIFTESENGYRYAAVTTLAKVTRTPPEKVAEYHRYILDITANTQAEGQAEEILQCLMELATKLEWYIVEGLEFEKTLPLELNTRMLISIAESRLR